MATEDDKAQDGWYRFTGMKNSWDETSALVLEGSATNPKVVINKGEEVELTGDQVEAARNMGANIRAVSDEKAKALEEQKDPDAESEAPRGSEQRPQAESGTTQPADVARAADEKSGGSKAKS